MIRNPIICILIVGLLIASLAGQAAAGFQTACAGKAVCCCRNDGVMSDTTADMPPMGKGCCETSATKPCDLAGPVSSPSDPFLPTENNIASDISVALADTVPASVKTLDGDVFARISLRPPSLAGPPVYLLNQTFLC